MPKEKLQIIQVSSLEKTILEIALDHHKAQLNAVLKKARFLGVEVSKATQADIHVLEELKNKLNGQEKLIK